MRSCGAVELERHLCWHLVGRFAPMTIRFTEKQPTQRLPLGGMRPKSWRHQALLRKQSVFSMRLVAGSLWWLMVRMIMGYTENAG